MAPLSTPQQILAGQQAPQLQPLSPLPTPSAGGQSLTPPDVQSATPPQDLLSGVVSNLPPPPPKGGVSESPKDQLLRMYAKNSDSLISQASNPAAPGAWARALVGGMQSALAGVGNIGTVPKGAGALYGVGKVMQANQTQQNEKQKQGAQEKQQKFENDEKLKEDERKDEAQNYERGLRYMQTQSYLSQATQDAQAQMQSDTAANVKAHEEGGARLVQKDLTSDDLKKLAKDEHSSPDDPNGTNWLMKQNVFQTSWKDDRDANGDIVPRYNEKGDVVGSQRRQTYSLYTWGDERKVDPSFAKDIHDYLHKEITDGTVLNPKDARSLEVQLEHAKAEEQAGLVALAAAGKTKDEISKYQHNADFETANRAFMPWLSDAKNDPGLALENMRLHAQEVGKDGQPTGEAMRAKEDLDQVTKGLGSEIVKQNLDTFGKEEVARTTANLKAAAAGVKDKALGDTSLNGQAYLNSIQDPAERALVQSVGTGHEAAQRMEYLIARNPRVAQEIALAYPGIDTGQIGAYIDASKKFGSGNIANQLNAVGTGMLHFKALLQDNQKPGALVGGDAYAQRQADLNDASMELARFLAGGNAPTKEDIEGARASLDPSVFRSLNPIESKNSAIIQQAQRMNEKREQYQTEWHDAQPVGWNKPLPGWSPENESAYQFIRNGGKEPAISVQIPNGPQIQFPNQAAADAFKKEHGIQ